MRALERSFSQACERGAFRLAHYSLQADHVHLVVEADDAAALGRGMSSIAARLARAVNRVFGRRGRVFADRFHHRVLRTPREVRNVLAYVLNNARKHVPGVARPGVRIETATGGIDPASSGRWFPGWRNGPAPPTDTLAPIARPRSWLLSKGWLRHGRIDPAEVPGGRKRGPGRRPAGSGASC